MPDRSLPPLGIFGGMFDPVHFGHLRVAFELRETLGLESVHFVPAADPPHRDRPLADGGRRLAMLRAAIAGEPRFVADDCELRRSGPSYTVLTLEHFRRQHGSRPLVLLLGLDAFLGLTSWHRWRELGGLAHLAVARRPGARLPRSGEVAELLAERREQDPARIAAAPAGRIYIHDGTQLDVASSGVRRVLQAGRDPRYLMPDAVRRMILDAGTYSRPGETKE